MQETHLLWLTVVVFVDQNLTHTYLRYGMVQIGRYTIGSSWFGNKAFPNPPVYHHLFHSNSHVGDILHAESTSWSRILLVGGFNSSEKYEFVNWDDYSQYIGK